MDINFNPDKQHTLSNSISISGTGLHTGILVDMTLKPANPGFGIQFQRVDLPTQPIIKADCDLVTDTSRGTTLQVGEATSLLILVSCLGLFCRFLFHYGGWTLILLCECSRECY